MATQTALTVRVGLLASAAVKGYLRKQQDHSVVGADRIEYGMMKSATQNKNSKLI
jgi:hypothetical protein